MAALHQRQALRFHYRKPGQKSASLRQVHPYHLTCSDNRWYVLAHDTDCGEVRTFALGRITAPVLTIATFTVPASFDPHKHLGASFSVMKGDGDYEVVIEFDAWATDLLRGRQWHPTQVVTELPCGGSERVMPTVRNSYRGLQGTASLRSFKFSDCVGRLYNRLNGDYEVLHGLCRFFLEQSGPLHSTGDHTMFPFLIDMAHLYELFVAEWLREHLPEGYTLQIRANVNFSEANRLKFIIDLVICDLETGRTLCVLDTK